MNKVSNYIMPQNLSQSKCNDMSDSIIKREQKLYDILLADY
jgi:hypothetical protein